MANQSNRWLIFGMFMLGLSCEEQTAFKQNDVALGKGLVDEAVLKKNDEQMLESEAKGERKKVATGDTVMSFGAVSTVVKDETALDRALEEDSDGDRDLDEATGSEDRDLEETTASTEVKTDAKDQPIPYRHHRLRGGNI